MITRAAAMWLAAVPPGSPDPSSGRGAEWGKAAPIGLLIILLLGIALFFLIRSMNRNLAKVPKSFDSQSFEAKSFEPGGAASGGTATTTVSASGVDPVLPSATAEHPGGPARPAGGADAGPGASG